MANLIRTRSTIAMRIVVQVLSVLLLNACRVSANWKQEHSVKGLPTTDGSELTSYAGVVAIRNDPLTNIEVAYNNIILLTKQ